MACESLLSRMGLVLSVMAAGLSMGCHQGSLSGKTGQTEIVDERPGNGQSYLIRKEGQVTKVSMVLANGLNVLLVSNPALKKGSASMAVPVGSWFDPNEHLGLAHYLEHMLFLGTKKYPSAKEYDAFITSHGGGNNAFTAAVQTNYHFEVNASAFEEALDRFGQFFIAPLFTAEFAEKEKNAVNNEYLGDLQKEGWRIQELVSVTSNTNHPRARFSIGTLDTLKDVTPEILRAFYEKYYSSDTMKLALTSPFPIEKMVQLVESIFSAVPNRNLTGKVDLGHLPLDQGGRWIEMKTLSNMRLARLSFPIGLATPDWKSKSAARVAAILGDHGEGGLDAYLKKKRLATSVGVEVSSEALDKDVNDYLNVYFELTAEGEKNLNKVFAEFFRYAGELKRSGLKKYSFDEAKALAANSSQYKDPEDGMGGARELSSLMLVYPALEAQDRSELLYERDEDGEKKILSAVRPDNVNVLVANNNVDGGLTEEFFQISYNLRAVSEAWKEKMQKALDSDSSADFSYPRPIQMMPLDFEIVKAAPQQVPVALHAPESTAKKIWVLTETSDIAKPKAFAEVQLISMMPSRSAKDSVLSEIWSKAFVHGRNAMLTELLKPGYSLAVSEVSEGMNFSFSGYSDHFQEVLKLILMNRKSPINDVGISATDFIVLKQQLKDGLEAQEYDQPYDQMRSEVVRMIDSRVYSREERLAALSKVSFQDLVSFSNELVSRLALKVFVYGNVLAESWQDFPSSMFEFYKAEPLTSAEIEKAVGHENPPSPGKRFGIAITSESNNHGIATSFFMGKREQKDMALNMVLGNLIEAPFYSELRTNQQLGYVVGAGTRNTRQNIRLSGLIQSGKYEGHELATRADRFFEQFSTELKGSSKEALESIRSQLIDTVADRGSNFAARYGYWQNLFEKMDSNWSLSEGLVDEIRSMSGEDLANFVARVFDPKQVGRLTVYHYAKGSSLPAAAPGEVMVKSREEYQSLNKAATEPETNRAAGELQKK